MNSLQLHYSGNATRGQNVVFELSVASSLGKSHIYEPPVDIEKKIREIYSKNSTPRQNSFDDSVLSKDFVFDCSKNKMLSPKNRNPVTSHRRTKSLNASTSREKKILKPLYNEGVAEEVKQKSAIQIHSVDNQSTINPGTIFNEVSLVEQSQDTHLYSQIPMKKLGKDGKKVFDIVLQERSTDLKTLFSVEKSKNKTFFPSTSRSNYFTSPMKDGSTMIDRNRPNFQRASHHLLKKPRQKIEMAREAQSSLFK